jgi:hypothetical protein
MKKYLMTGIAAVAMCAAFTSCSKNDADLYNPDEIAQNEFEAKIARYNEAFVNTFGQPAATQDWGFGNYFAKSARTRADINVNGNLWKSCPELGDTEEDDVVKYVQELTTKPNTNPIQLTDYYVTQVHCGTEIYANAGGGVGIKGSGHMDNLQIAMTKDATITDGVLSTGWQHINNFNRGDNTDWKGNTLVTSGGTFDFAYNGSEDSKYHNRWIAIDGKDIDDKYAGYYYVCFDFEAAIPAVTRFSNIEFYDPVTKQWKNSSTIDIPGTWSAETLLASELTLDLPAETHWDATIPNQWGGMGVNVVDRYVTVHFNNRDEVKSATFSNVLGDNMIINPNSSYLDWIIRLVKAEPKEQNDKVVRVIAEDMAGYSADDFDFNDVVFDCELDENENVTKITLIHTGAEFSITVDGNEVHEKFGLLKNPNRPQYWTMGSGNYSFTPSQTYKVADIPVVVTQIIEVQGENGTIEYKEKKITLTAPTGFTTGKLAVGRDFGIVPERQNIDTYTKGKFSTYVQNGGVWNQWYK